MSRSSRPPMLTRRGLFWIGAWLALVVGVPGSFWLFDIAFEPQCWLFDCGPTDAELEPFHHYVRFEADIVFDGEPIRLAQLIDCVPHARGGTIGGRAGWQFHPSQLEVAALLPDGGAIYVYPGVRLCALWRTKWDARDPDARSYDLPENYLPLFYWIDDAAAPSVMEAYVSAAYYDQPYARLQINAINAAFVSAEEGNVLTASVEATAEDLPRVWRDWSSPQWAGLNRGYPLPIWSGTYLAQIDEQEWRQYPWLADQIALVPETADYFKLNQEENFPLSNYDVDSGPLLRTRSARNAIHPDRGIPHTNPPYGLLLAAPDAYPAGTNLEQEYYTADNISPVACEDTRCGAIPGRRGYLIANPHGWRNTLELSRTVELGGASVPAAKALGWIYDPDTRSIFYVRTFYY